MIEQDGKKRQGVRSAVDRLSREAPVGDAREVVAIEAINATPIAAKLKKEGIVVVEG